MAGGDSKTGQVHVDLRAGVPGIPVGMSAEEHDPPTERIIGCGIEVHRTLGPGLLERA